jgi:hypothetical protein
MAYNTDELYKLALKQIKKHKPHSILQLCGLIGISHDTFYNHFPIDSDKSDNIKREMQLVAAEVTAATIKKTLEADTPTDRAMILKIYGGNEMRRKLATNYNEVTGKDGDAIKVDPFTKIRENNGIDREAKGSDSVVNG